MKVNPGYYGLQSNVRSAEAFDRMLMEKLILANVKTLEAHELVRQAVVTASPQHSYSPVQSPIDMGKVINQALTDEDGFSLRPTIPGRLMAHHYIGLQVSRQSLCGCTAKPLIHQHVQLSLADSQMC